MENTAKSVLTTVIAAAAGVVLRALEYIVTDPDEFDKHPLYVMMFQWDLLIASGTVLLSAYVAAHSSLQGRLVPPVFGLLVAFALILLSLGISEASWASELQLWFRVYLPDFLSGGTFGWSVLVVRNIAEAQEVIVEAEGARNG
jgi:hypothetical protein